ncbi:hypothetical protein IAE22_35620, partial [Bacillus sp. S34]|nr:hypothetical protein [Bacillus sp. S34]
MKKAPDNDKIRRKAASESSEKQAQKVRQMESRIARLVRDRIDPAVHRRSAPVEIAAWTVPD